jgi:hypothetical protein
LRERRRQQGPVAQHERMQFLTALGRGSSVENAARMAGRSRQRFYELRQRDENFRAEWERAEHGAPLMFVKRPGEDEIKEALAPASDLHGKVAALMQTGRYSKEQEPLLYHQFGGAMSAEEWERVQERERRAAPDYEVSRRDPGKPRYIDPSYEDAY